jgi:hypothetical protein
LAAGSLLHLVDFTVELTMRRPLPAAAAPGTISEKTVELNFTLELVNHLSRAIGRPCIAWGPTLRQEANWGFDAGIGSAGSFVYLQFKKAYDEAPGHRYQLNRTKAQDQHAKLLALESAGCGVWYLLPKFTTLTYMALYRRRLLVSPHSIWFRPSALPVPNGGVGHHDLHVHPGRVWLTSEPVDVSMPENENPADRIRRSATPINPETTERWSRLFLEIFGEDQDAADGTAFVFLPDR